MKRRFVILRHEMPPSGGRASHWDLMLEGEEALSTWALPREPRQEGEQPAERLADHRKAYLDYEGPVSGDRGHVARWDSGRYRLEQADDDRWVALLYGKKLRCRVTLRRQPDAADGVQRWTCRFEGGLFEGGRFEGGRFDGIGEADAC